MAARLLEQFGQAAFEQLTQVLRSPAPLDLRVNLLRGKRAQAQQQLEADGIACSATPWSPWGLRMVGKPALHRHELMQKGWLEAQDEGSQLLALFTDARRGETVADFCAGAGGKTLALGAMMRSTGRLYAFDTSAQRLSALQPRMQRSGLNNVTSMVLQSEQDERLQRLQAKVDRVLVDAPCSGLGTLRRHPDLAWRLRPKELEELPLLQQRILEAAAKLLKPGGTLVYATCSLLDEENTKVSSAFSAAHPEFEPLNAATVASKHGLEALIQANGSMVLTPHQHQTDGFYMTSWRLRT